MIHHLGIFVRDFKPVLEFYQKVLGFKRLYSFSVRPRNIEELFAINSKARAWVLEAGNVRIEFIKLAHQSKHIRTRSLSGLHHMSIKLRHPAMIIERARKFGSKITQTYRRDHMTYFITDPEGNAIEVSESRVENTNRRARRLARRRKPRFGHVPASS